MIRVRNLSKISRIFLKIVNWLTSNRRLSVTAEDVTCGDFKIRSIVRPLSEYEFHFAVKTTG